MKTILDWLKEIPDAEVREKAIANYDQNFSPNEVANSISDAIEYGFDWDKTKESGDYWINQHNKYLKSTPETTSSLTEELQQELDRHNKAILEILKKHRK